MCRVLLKGAMDETPIIHVHHLCAVCLAYPLNVHGVKQAFPMRGA